MPSRNEPKQACCLVSEILEEAGLDRERARQLRKQILRGIIQLCQWQLDRIDGGQPGPREPRVRKVRLD